MKHFLWLGGFHFRHSVVILAGQVEGVAQEVFHRGIQGGSQEQQGDQPGDDQPANAFFQDPDLFFRFNSRSLLNYSMDELIKAGAEMVDRMAMRRNEWRDWMGLEYDPEMDELLALENYIPADRLGDQSKLTGGET